MNRRINFPNADLSKSPFRFSNYHYLISHFSGDSQNKTILIFENKETYDRYLDLSAKHAASYSSPEVLTPIEPRERTLLVVKGMRQKRVTQRKNGQWKFTPINRQGGYGGYGGVPP